MLYYTALFGIGLGITNLAIYGAEQRSKKVKEDSKRKSKINDYLEDSIDDLPNSKFNKHEIGDPK